MKRMVSFILLACLLFTVCACSQAPEEVVPEYSSQLGEVDFMGEEFIFLINNSGYSIGEQYLGYLYDTEFADLAKDIFLSLNR